MKNKKGELTTGGIVLLVMGIIVALVLIQAIFGDQTKMTTKSVNTNETVNIGAAKNGSGFVNTSYYFNLVNGCPEVINDWRIAGGANCYITVSQIYLSNGTALVENTDYVVNQTAGQGFTSCTSSRGDIRFLMTTKTNSTAMNSTRVTYSYCQDGYAVDSASRTVVSLIGLFAAIALMAFVVYMGLRQWADM